jgi:prepilin-type N-terminal cleavage/methylation domain-containing protein
MRPKAGSDVRGFSLTELMLVVAVGATLMAIAVPVFTSISDATKLSNAAQAVERELQTARMRAVSSNTSLRVRTNCPQAGYYRIIERLGTSADGNLSRCSLSSYPWPAADTDLATEPNYDGPVRQMLNDAAVSDGWLEFRPDGTAWQVVSGTAAAITTPVAITVTRNGQSKSITVNELGKVLLQ